MDCRRFARVGMVAFGANNPGAQRIFCLISILNIYIPGDGVRRACCFCFRPRNTINTQLHTARNPVNEWIWLWPAAILHSPLCLSLLLLSAVLATRLSPLSQGSHGVPRREEEKFLAQRNVLFTLWAPEFFFPFCCRMRVYFVVVFLYCIHRLCSFAGRTKNNDAEWKLLSYLNTEHGT